MENTFGIDIIPENDDKRIEALKRYKILDTPPEGVFDNIARLATQIFKVPISLISLVDAENVHFKANVGMGNARVTSRGVSLCSLAVLKPEVTVFEDAATEPCLLTNPNVAGSFGLKFYAGAPLKTHDGFLIGTMCIIDKTPRRFSPEDQVILEGLAKIVMDEIELRLAAIKETDDQLTIQEELQASIEEQASINDQLVTTNKELAASQMELKAALTMLSISEARARDMIRDAPIAIAIMNGRDLIVENANNTILEAWGKTDAIIGKPLHIALPELQGQEFLNILDNVFTSGNAFYGNEVRALLERNGVLEEVYFNFVYHPVKDKEGQTQSIMAIATVVTEQVKARRGLERLNSQLNLAVDAAKLGIWHIDPVNKALKYNDVLARIFGYEGDEPMTYEQAIGQVTESFRPVIEAEIERSIADSSDYDITYSQRRFNDDEVIWLRSLGKVVAGDNGKQTVFSGIVMDVTVAKADEQRKNDFIAMVSHELKTPLTSMSAYLQMLAMKAKKSEDSFTFNTLEKANKQVAKMSSMINGFLNVSRLESGKIHVNKQLFDMADLIKEAEEESVATISSHTVIFAPVEPTVVLADRDKIGQVITNFINNAVKYSASGTIINVACITTVGGNAQVSVKDRGLGIAQTDIPKLFERYYRVEGNGMKSISGFGIGLYLCSEIIQRHQGKIWVESEVGKGSAFYFSLPIQAS